MLLVLLMNIRVQGIHFNGFKLQARVQREFNATPLDAVPIPDTVQPNWSTAELESAAILISELESVELNPLNSKLLTRSPRPETRLRS